MADDAILAQRAQIEQEIAGRTLCDLLQDNADRHGDTPAVSWRDGGTWRTLSWSEYRQRVGEVAAGLTSLGVDHGDFVALMLSNRPEHVLADQGAVHAGAVPTTLYATLAPEQIRYCAADCAAKVAILEHRDQAKRWQELREGLPALEHVVVLEGAGDLSGWEGMLGWDELLARGRDALAADPALAGRLRARVRPEDPVTLLYTSGTTGPPKGVVLTHQGVLYECAALDRLLGLPDGIAGVSYLPFAHIAERLFSLYSALWKHNHVYFCPELTEMLGYVQHVRPIVAGGVPRVLEKLWAGLGAKLQAEPPRRRRLAHAAIGTGRQVVRRRQRGQTVPLVLRARHALLDRLVLAKIRAALGMDRCRYLLSGAAPLAVDLAESFAALGLPVVEMWGLSETSGVVTGNPPDAIRIGTVGPPLAGIELKLADDGEVLVRGPITTPGYYRQPEATAALLDADGWLRTGDVGTIDDAGYLRIVDRKKELIITAGGKNVSPANIEGLLKEHPLVGQALAFGDRRPYVVALVVLDHEVAAGWAMQRGIADVSLAALAEHPLVVEEVQHAMEAANQRLARVEQVKRFKILPAEWTAESEELTPTLKLKRRVICGKYAPEIDALYGDTS
jgi:long-subunit acyl-CoA synthetase (AMP-forming)